MNDLTVVEPTSADIIRSRILTIRGVQVMLDRDLAELYGVPTKVLNQAVKRNIERFPERFMFQLTKDEVPDLRSQIVTLNKRQGQHLKEHLGLDLWKSVIFRRLVCLLLFIC